MHDFALVYLGVHIFDNVDLEALAEAAAARKRWDFLLTVAPLAIPALLALRERADARELREGDVPVALGQAIAGFETELSEARRQIRRGGRFAGGRTAAR